VPRISACVHAYMHSSTNLRAPFQCIPASGDTFQQAHGDELAE
jgi:hypothetical protein